MTDAELEAIRELLNGRSGVTADGSMWVAAENLLAEVDRLRAAVQQERAACAAIAHTVANTDPDTHSMRYDAGYMAAGEDIAAAIRRRDSAGA